VHIPELVRYSVLGIWGVLWVGSFVLRLNAKHLSPTALRYLAYLAYTNLRDLLNSPASSYPPLSASAESTAS